MNKTSKPGIKMRTSRAERNQEEADLRSSVQAWLRAAGDKGVARLYSHIRQVAAKEGPGTWKQRMGPSLYLYWIVAQLSGQDSNLYFQDMRSVAKERNIPLNLSMDGEVSELVSQLGGGNRTQAAAVAAEPVRLRPLRLFSETAYRPHRPWLKSEGDNSLEKVNNQRRRRIDPFA